MKKSPSEWYYRQSGFLLPGCIIGAIVFMVLALLIIVLLIKAYG